eukprot:scaffold253_cov243-Pinguiococcus_pyrenoidosus.AAC.9
MSNRLAVQFFHIIAPVSYRAIDRSLSTAQPQLSSFQSASRAHPTLSSAAPRVRRTVRIPLHYSAFARDSFSSSNAKVREEPKSQRRLVASDFGPQLRCEDPAFLCLFPRVF